MAVVALNTRLEVDRRSGFDRRQDLDRNYLGPERRSRSDRRSAACVRQRGRAELSAAPLSADHGSTAPVFAHRLQPAKGQRFHNPLVVVQRLVSEFPYVEADEDEGRRHVLEVMKRVEAKIGQRKNGILNQFLERLERIKERAIYARFGNDPSTETEHLCAAVIPDEPLVFEYESTAHERAVWPLLRRCARVLGYEIVKVTAEDFIASLSLHPQQ